jgi:hypothetical protein
MKSFEPGLIERQLITQNLLRTIRTIGEYKGKQELFKEQSPQVLSTLQQAAIIQSTESSNRIEGVEAPLQRIKALVAQKTTPQNRSEQEIAGYRDVLNTIHANYGRMPLAPAWCYNFTEIYISFCLERAVGGSQLTTRSHRLAPTAPQSCALNPSKLFSHQTRWRNYMNASIPFG